VVLEAVVALVVALRELALRRLAHADAARAGRHGRGQLQLVRARVLLAKGGGAQLVASLVAQRDHQARVRSLAAVVVAGFLVPGAILFRVAPVEVGVEVLGAHAHQHPVAGAAADDVGVVGRASLQPGVVRVQRAGDGLAHADGRLRGQGRGGQRCRSDQKGDGLPVHGMGSRDLVSERCSAGEGGRAAGRLRATIYHTARRGEGPRPRVDGSASVRRPGRWREARRRNARDCGRKRPRGTMGSCRGAGKTPRIRQFAGA
jgi:hypothetical protein